MGYGKKKSTKPNAKEAVFVLLGQSNAVGHNLLVRKCDVIATPLKNVFGLSRQSNQSFDNLQLRWTGYTSFGTNLTEEQDNTYSVANCLAKLWQEHIDNGNKSHLLNLYIVQIAVGAQGVSDGFMWNPSKKQTLVAGKLGEVDISLFSFTKHILQLIDKSFCDMQKDYEIIGLHWRGGEEDIVVSREDFCDYLQQIYTTMIDDFNHILHNPPIVLHKIICYDRANDLDPSGKYANNLKNINKVFCRLQNNYQNVSVFDVQQFCNYKPNVRGNGVFMEDVVHYTEDVNRWVAQSVLDDFVLKHCNDVQNQ